jgi:ABC-2 type transport system permease protein
VTGDWSTGLQGQVSAGLVMLPAVYTLAALVLLALAVVPRAAGAIGWGALAASFVLGQLGAILDLPQVVLNLSPFTHVPAVPAQPVRATPIIALAVTAIVLTAAAFVAHRRRDLVTAA